MLLDEPLAGLAAAERERVAQLVKRISSDLPVLLVEHDIDRVFALADRVTVMNDGKVLFEGNAADARVEPGGARDLYRLRHRRARRDCSRQCRAGRAPALLTLDAVDAFYGKSHIIKSVALTVHEHEIVALLGRNGAGKSTLLKTIIGTVSPANGTIALGDLPLAGLPAWQIARLGVGYVPQGRALFAGMSVRDNLALARLKRKAERADQASRGLTTRSSSFFRSLQRGSTHRRTFLSGGEQQMVAVARALAGHVRVLLLDEPFEGLAPTVIEELFTAFDRLRAELAIVIVEHNLDLVLALADRAYVLERGSVVHQGPAAALREESRTAEAGAVDVEKKIARLSAPD